MVGTDRAVTHTIQSQLDAFQNESEHSRFVIARQKLNHMHRISFIPIEVLLSQRSSQSPLQALFNATDPFRIGGVSCWITIVAAHHSNKQTRPK